MLREQPAEAMRGDHVHVIPPGAGDDHLLVEREDRRSLEHPRRADAGEIDGHVALLAVARAWPNRERRGRQSRGVGEARIGEELLCRARRAGEETPRKGISDFM